MAKRTDIKKILIIGSGMLELRILVILRQRTRIVVFVTFPIGHVSFGQESVTQGLVLLNLAKK